MTLSVLTDAQIQGLLEGMTVQELLEFQANLKAALHEYSTSTQSTIHMPERTSMFNVATGTNTLFMPSSSSAGSGVKAVVTLSAADADRNAELPVVRPTGAVTLFSPLGEPVGILHASTLTAFRTALASLCLVGKRAQVKTLTVFGCGEQAYWHVRLALMLRGSTIRQVNFVNRRFGPSCSAILKRFYSVGASVKAREGWTECTFGVLTPGYGEYERLLEKQVLAADIIFCCTPSTEPVFKGSWLTSHDARRKGRLIVAIGSYTPQMREIPIDVLMQAVKPHERGHRHFHKHVIEGGAIVVDTLDGALKEAGELIEAGLEPTQLVELGELVMLHNIAATEAAAEEEVAPETASVTSFSSDPSGDMEKLTISSGRSALSNVFGSSGSRSSSPAGIRAPSFPFHRRSSSLGSVDRQKKKKEKEDAMAKWLEGGNVIYKSVGLGLMDLTVGTYMVKFAREKGVGSHVEGF
ncbi:ornithine cyclodeaminase/mu-crystallin family protein [Immersiella caudata]|uniref:Ornithine cyclodeaminase/mu-crystallin family protein n=1 Tax=Immersiella caudata TaxID=314043 RepID=A0AA40BXD5_9PEZI|nr:ornithine cyclodeaminase/mu-crystallin family protein [Immersiella caudata]